MKKTLLGLALLASINMTIANVEEVVSSDVVATEVINSDVVPAEVVAAEVENNDNSKLGLFSLSSEETQKVMSSLNEYEIELVNKCTKIVVDKLRDLNELPEFRELKVVLSEKLGREVEIVVQLLLSLYELKQKTQEVNLSLEQ